MRRTMMRQRLQRTNDLSREHVSVGTRLQRVCHWVLGVVATSMVFLVIVPGTAVASCVSSHTAVQGFDNAYARWGNAGVVYINTQTTLGNLYDHLFRSLFVSPSALYNAEVGWMDNNEGYSTPTVYSEEEIDGTEHYPVAYTGYSLAYDTYTEFKVQNTTHDGFFRFYVATPGTAGTWFHTSDQFPTNDQIGLIITNSEHYNSCDSLWTDMGPLYYYDSSGNWNLGYGDLEPYCNQTSGNWFFYKKTGDNTEQWVDSDLENPPGSQNPYPCV
jgi:hypothetical protein